MTDATDESDASRPTARRSDDPDESVPRLLPSWWADAATEFRAYDLRPYRPPRFADGVVVPPLVDRLESTYCVRIKLVGVDVQYGDPWDVSVDGDVVATVGRERTRAGHTRYELTSDAFERVVREAIEE
ncbi:MAG: hypothetical protein ABEJ78_11935 [Haloferacaceae archaeon]